MDENLKEFVSSLLKQANTHDEWLQIMKFGLPTLVKDQDFLFSLILEAVPNLNQLPRLLDELGLHFEVT